MIHTKDSVNHRMMSPQILLAILRADQLNAFHFQQDTVITSITDNAPGRVSNSLHKNGNAVDLSIKDHPNAQQWFVMIKEALGPQFDVLLHDVSTGLHIHIEFDPKDTVGQVKV
jgi:hypothetical protein